jgi:hypothetical protein
VKRSAGLIVAVAVLTTGCGGTQAVRPAASVRGPGFSAAAGWHTLGFGLSQPPNAPDASAANVRFARADRSQSAPTRTVATLPRRGIVIWAQLQARWTAVDNRFPVRRPALREAVPIVGMEGFGLPAAGSVRRLEARTAGYDVDVSVFFGAKHPSAAEMDAANRELARLFFPGCPRNAERLRESDARAAAGATLGWLRRSLVAGFRPAIRGAKASGTVVSSRTRDIRVKIVEQLCGKTSGRIVAVRIWPAKKGSAELGSELLYFLAKTSRGWLVWREG